MDECPTERAVVAYVEGRLDPPSSDLLERHAAECKGCSERISVLSGNGGTVPESARISTAGAVSSKRQVGRYGLVRLLGRGGMGAVYEAHDTELDRHVALKLLRERWSDESTWSKLRREAQAMAKLAHPNVVVIHDVGVADGQPYLTMELVDGVTLTKWLAERPRRWRQILDAFMQAGRGLAAAHAVGIVHRDFKPDNVLVSRSGRVCVTDFGIAVRAEEAGSAVTGTPAYMSPEQMSFGPVDARADVFAFCVALFAALYGTRPFTGGTLAELRDAIVAQKVNPPVKKGAPAWVRDALLLGMRALPSERYATMNALLTALDPSPRARRWKAGLGAAAAVAFAATAVLGWRVEAKRITARGLLVDGGATRVAVAVVDRAPAGRDGAAEVVAPIVGATLGSFDRVVVVDPAFVARMAAAEQAQGGVDPERLAAAVGAARVVLVELDAGSISVMIDDAVPRAAPLYQTSERIAGGDWAKAARALAADVADAVSAPTGPAHAAADAAAPANGAAALTMGRALRAEAAHDAVGAAALYDDSCRADPAAAAPCARRAALLFSLGDTARALPSAQAALDRSATAPADVRAELEALRHSIAGEHDQAIQLYRDLWSAHRDDRARAVALARAQSRAGLRNDATATIDAVRARGVAVGVDPEVDLCETDLRYLVFNDAKGALVIARAVLARADSIGDRWLGARARYKEALALIDISGPADGEALLATASQLYLAEHDLDSAAWVDMNVAVARATAGDETGARDGLADVVARARDLGDITLERLSLGNLAVVYTNGDDLGMAIDTVKRLVPIWRDANNDSELARQLSNLCTMMGDHGDLRDGVSSCEEALAIRRRIAEKSGILSSLVNVAIVEWMSGDVAAADAHDREALSLALELGERVPYFRNQVADGLVEEHRYAEAEPFARTAIEEAVAASDADNEGTARAILARILAETGRAEEARKAVVEAEQADARAPTRDSQTTDAIELAYAKLALARTPADRAALAKSMSDLADEATRQQWLADALEARLVRARALGSASELSSVEADARVLGQVTLADQARDANSRLASL